MPAGNNAPRASIHNFDDAYCAMSYLGAEDDADELPVCVELTSRAQAVLLMPRCAVNAP